MLCIVSALTASAWDGSEGKVYLQNVGSGLWWGAGNSWGTQASLLPHPEYVTLHLSDGKYTLESQVSNGGNKIYFNGSYMDNGSPVNLTITASGDYWTVANGETYYGYDGSTIGNVAGCVLGSGVDATTDNGKWRIFTEEEMLANMANATETNPVDATFLLLDPSYGRNNRNANAWTQSGGNNTLSGGDNTNCVSESWQSAFETKQTATVPNGYYRLTAQTFLREYTATGTDLPYIYLNEAKKDFNLMVTTTAALSDVSNYFTNGTDGGYYTTTDVVTVTGKSITVGAKGTRTNTWAVWDNFVLQYLGPIDLTEYATGLANAVAAAEATEGTIPTAAYNAIAAVVTENNKEYDNGDDYTTAIQAINNAVSTYASDAIVVAYSEYKDLKAAVLALNSGIDVSAADDLAEAATTADLSEANASLRSAAKSYLSSTEDTNVDITAIFVTNPGFELGNVSGWTNSGTQAAGAQGNKVFDNTQGNYYAERWHQDGTVDLNQTVNNLPAGVYEIGAYLYTDTNDGVLYANDTKTSFKTSGWYTARVAIDADGSIKFGASCTLTTSTWICMDGFKLTLVSAGLPDVTAITGKMNAEVAAAQTTAIETYNANKTVANYNAAQAAIANAEASIAAYAAANTAVAKANAIKEAHNFASTTATTTFTEAIATIQTGYDEGTLTNDEANAAGTTLGVVVTGWHGGNNNAAAVYLRDGFSLGDIAADPALHVNTWSTEGDNDGTGFSVPFYESWTSDANSLPESTITGTLTDLPNGLYEISAWVRVRANNSTEATAATGITMDVNGGGEGDYAAIDVTEGEQVGTSKFNIGTYTAQGLVKQGTLTLNFNISADANISWLAFKNVKYTKVRDLTPEEAFVAATEEDYAALNAAIEEAEAKTLGFDEGDHAPYNNIEALAVLAAAKAIDQEVENAQEDVQAATDALTGATWNANATEVNAFYDGTFAAAENNGAPKGWRMSNNTLGGSYHSRAFNPDENNRLSEFNETNSGLFLRFDGTNSSRGSMYYYGDTENYTMPLKAETWYYVKVDFAGWGSTGKPLRMNVTGPEGFTAKNQQFNTSVRADNADNTPQQFLIVFQTTTAGNYVINFQTPGADSNTHNVVISNCELFRADEVTMSIKANKYGTFIAPFDVTIPADVKAYGISEMNGTEVVLAEVETTIPANTPVVVENTTAEAVSEKFYGKNTATEDSYTVGYLTGVYEATEIPVGAYVLQTQNDKQAFYKVESTGFTATPNRAYLSVPAGQSEGVKAFYLGGDTDGISSLVNDLQNGDIYDLAGRKVQHMQKGNIYIVNGRKVVVK